MIYFENETTRNKKMMVILSIIMGLFLMVLGLTLGLRTVKPFSYNLIAGLVILIGTFFDFLVNKNKTKIHQINRLKL